MNFLRTENLEKTIPALKLLLTYNRKIHQDTELADRVMNILVDINKYGFYFQNDIKNARKNFGDKKIVDTIFDKFMYDIENLNNLDSCERHSCLNNIMQIFFLRPKGFERDEVACAKISEEHLNIINEFIENNQFLSAKYPKISDTTYEKFDIVFIHGGYGHRIVDRILALNELIKKDVNFDKVVLLGGSRVISDLSKEKLPEDIETFIQSYLTQNDEVQMREHNLMCVIFSFMQNKYELLNLLPRIDFDNRSLIEVKYPKSVRATNAKIYCCINQTSKLEVVQGSALLNNRSTTQSLAKDYFKYHEMISNDHGFLNLHDIISISNQPYSHYQKLIVTANFPQHINIHMCCRAAKIDDFSIHDFADNLARTLYQFLSCYGNKMQNSETLPRSFIAKQGASLTP